jgi:hypothetical protein
MRRAARIDNTAKELSAYLRSKGVLYWPINGDVDGIAWLGSKVAVIDWKSPGGALTDTQAKMVAKGCKIWFLSTPEQVDQMLVELK